ncbi:hypothetical protein HpNP140_11880 [Helicobacter pylori]
MSKIKPQIKKNNSSKSHYSTGWNVFWCGVLDLEKWFLNYLIGIRKIRKNNHELFKNLTL